MTHVALTTMILELNSLIDSGEHDDITVEQAVRAVAEGSVLRLVRERAGREFLYPCAANPAFEGFYSANLLDILEAYGGSGRRKWGVEKKGLCLLLAWTTEILQRGSSWEAAEVG